MTHKNILLVDDDTDLSALIAEFLEADGFTVTVVHSGEAALEELSTDGHGFDAAVLDIMMPGLTGMQVLQSVRGQSSLPVIMLTGRGDDIDRIVGLEMGADDYLAKPCNPKELAARLRAVLRRSKDGSPNIHTKQLDVGILKVDLGKREAWVDGNPLELTSAEFGTLVVMMQNAGKIVSKETLCETVLQRKLTPFDRAMDVHISRIRKKVAGTADRPDIFKTIRGKGWQLLV